MDAESANDSRAPLQDVVWKDPGRAGGKLCFRGTRVPVQALADYLHEGHSLDRFLESFPTGSRKQATQFLYAAVETTDQMTQPEDSPPLEAR